jgi:protein tyrosine/serine phosphatase
MGKVRVGLVLLVLAAGCDKEPSKEKGAGGAVVAVEAAGCANLYKVNDVLYRGAQPEKEGFAKLEELGIKTVVNLRDLHSDRKLLEGTGLSYVHIDMQAWDAERDEVKEFLEIATDESKQPVFVHCQHGADRTGTMVAVYRIVVEGWDKERALAEMTEGPFGFHSVWRGLPKFVRELDVEKLREELELGPRRE